MKKTLELLLSGFLGLATIITGCAAVPANIPQVKNEQIQIQRLPLEKRLYELVEQEDFDRAEAAFIASGVNEYELEYLMGFTDRLSKKVDEEKQLKHISDKKKRARFIFEYLCENSAPQRYEEDMKRLSYSMRSLRGDCVGLSFLTMSISERLGIPMNLMKIPGHVFPSMEYNGETIYIESIERNGFNMPLREILRLKEDDEMIPPKKFGKKESIALLLVNLGSVEERDKRYGNAMGFYLASATILPDTRNTNGLSHLLRRFYGVEKEIETLKKIYNRHPKNPCITEILSKALFNRGKEKDIENAAFLFSQVIDDFPDDDFKNSYMGILYARLKRYKESAKYFQRANEPKG